jgi:hypothetical protein
MDVLAAILRASRNKKSGIATLRVLIDAALPTLLAFASFAPSR